MTTITDAWTDESFESEVMKAMTVIYDIRPDKAENFGKAIGAVQRTGEGHWRIKSDPLSVTKQDVAAIKKSGAYLPAPDRLFTWDSSDLAFGMPTSGCVQLPSLESPGVCQLTGEVLNEYATFIHFRRMPKLPNGYRKTPGVPYRLVKFNMFMDGTVGGFSSTHTVSTAGVRLSNPIDMSTGAGATDILNKSLLFALQAVEDSRHTWTLTTRTEESRIMVGCYAENVKSLLYSRQLPLTPSGRRAPILHVVSAHRRRLKAGIDVDISEFLRGTREVLMDGVQYTVSPPAKYMTQLNERKVT